MGTVGLVVLIGVCGVTGVRSWGWNALFSSINDFLEIERASCRERV